MSRGYDRSRARPNGVLVSDFLAGGSFDALSPGATTAPAGFTFTRSSTATTHDETAGTVTTGLGVDVPRVARDASGRAGLLIEPARTNLIPTDSVLSGGGWAAGSGATETANAVAGPDGTTTADRSAGASGAYANIWSKGATHSVGTVYAISCWLKNNGGGNFSSVSALYVVTASPVTPTASWARFRRTATDTSAGAGNNYIFVDGRDQSAAGGNVAAAYDVYRWGHQVELASGGTSARWASSLIQTSGTSATRAADVLTVPSATVVTAESLRFYAKVVAPASRANLAEGASTTLTLFRAGSYYAQMATGTGVITVSARNSGDSAFTTDTTTTGIAIAAGDVVELWCVLGGNAGTTIKYRINGGSITTLTMTGATALRVLTSGASPIGASIDVLHNAGADMLPGLVQSLAFYRATKAPAGF